MGSFTVIQALWGFLSNILWVSKIAFETDQSAIRVGPECSQGLFSYCDPRLPDSGILFSFCGVLQIRADMKAV